MLCAALISSVLVVSYVSRVECKVSSDPVPTASRGQSMNEDYGSLNKNKTNIFLKFFKSMFGGFKSKKSSLKENSIQRPTLASLVTTRPTYDYTVVNSTKIVSVRRLAWMYRYAQHRVTHRNHRTQHTVTAEPSKQKQRPKRAKLVPRSTSRKPQINLGKNRSRSRPRSTSYKPDNQPYELGERTESLRQALSCLLTMENSDDLLVHKGQHKWYIRDKNREIHRIVMLSPGDLHQNFFLAKSEDGLWHKFIKPPISFLQYVARIPRQFDNGRVSCDSKNWYIRNDKGLYRRLVNQGLIVQENNAHVQSEDGVWYRLRNETQISHLVSFIKKLPTYQPDIAELEVEPTNSADNPVPS